MIDHIDSEKNLANIRLRLTVVLIERKMGNPQPTFKKNFPNCCLLRKVRSFTKTS